MKLSIAVITYNHEKFIKQTLEGILKQNVNFSYEIIIGEDRSTDNTKEILAAYEKKYPGRFLIKYRNPNMGAIPNFCDIINTCKGEYIAFCEGDDYWTDPLKLQKQVDFLDSNLDYGICCHEFKKFIEDKGVYEDSNYSNIPETTTIKDLAKWCYIATNTAVIRNDFILPDWFSHLKIGDWPLFLFQIQNRKIKKMNDQMSVYRIHSGGLWTSASQLKRNKGDIEIINSILKNNFIKDSKAISNLKIKLITCKINILKIKNKNRVSLLRKNKIFWLKSKRSYMKRI